MSIADRKLLALKIDEVINLVIATGSAKPDTITEMVSSLCEENLHDRNRVLQPKEMAICVRVVRVSHEQAANIAVPMREPWAGKEVSEVQMLCCLYEICNTYQLDWTEDSRDRYAVFQLPDTETTAERIEEWIAKNKSTN